MGDAGKDSGEGPGGRPNLPGIPSYVDRVSAECIWKTNCNSEAAYIRERNKNPPKTREHFGTLHGLVFRRLDRERAPQSPAGSQLGVAFEKGSTLPNELGDASYASSWKLARAPTPVPSTLAADAMQELSVEDQLLAATKNSQTYFGTSVPKAIPVPTTNFVIPKYRFAVSMDHMHKLAQNPNSNRSAKALARAMSTPNVRGA